MRDPRCILITGGSSGIGAALARLYAAPGTRLLLTGRDPARLAAVAADCAGQGAAVETTTTDVTDRDALAAWLLAQDDSGPIDLVLANAGISAGTGGGVETEAQARAVFATNLDGVMNTIHPLIPRMQARRRGQLGLMASLAGFRGLPGAPAYCASKAAVRVYGEALRADLAPHGVGVSVICPGFVRTPMTDVNRFPMPFLMDADRAARIIRRGLERDRARIAFPFGTYLVSWLLGTLPPLLIDPFLAALPRKG
ncbi:SDR family NAD(P)-dependent oxidoreductase [Aerophototrophica crusticola]|uniref:SDR family NAD(P)-dependent oxidoreductase n=1 Tax=Aerophototrophica crusticola TaxID=1709002 RepID=A0A858R4X3_9PROT|nr:SDR family NAD(P)-dependent oxidoreductase [Rhodospirillaceae bacterium B3]